MRQRALLRKKLSGPTPLIAPGIYDGLSARLADPHGFDLLYLSGYGVSASLLAKPDNGHLSRADMVFRIESICAAISTPLIGDADTGFGGPEETEITVRAYEAAGAAGIQIEDQQVPKICGHIPGREVVSRNLAVEKIAAAAQARTDEDFLIVARTDAREQEGLDEAIARGAAFAAAGADIVFVESPESEAEFEEIGKALAGVPLLANMVEGGRSPLIAREKLAAYGFKVIIYPVAPMAAAAKALDDAYRDLRTHEPQAARLSFDELSRSVGLNKTE